MQWQADWGCLKTRFLGKQVRVVEQFPEYARFLDRVGLVKGVNCNGRVLVQFAGEDRAWYDIPPEALRVVGDAAARPDPGEGGV